MSRRLRRLAPRKHVAPMCEWAGCSSPALVAVNKEWLCHEHYEAALTRARQQVSLLGDLIREVIK